jgi:ParB family chromosome partitioning protein
MPRAKKAKEVAAPAPDDAPPAPAPWWEGGPLDTAHGMPWHVAALQVPDGEIIELAPGTYSTDAVEVTTSKPHRLRGKFSSLDGPGGVLAFLSTYERHGDPESLMPALPAEKPIKCIKCDQRFDTSDQLMEHFNREHPDDPPRTAAKVPQPPELIQDPKQFMTTLELDRIEITGWNPRKDFDAEELQGLADSIKAEGLHDPIIVRRKPGSPEFGSIYQLVDGERRVRAHRLLGLTTIRAIVEDMDDKRVRRIMLISTLQRAELKPMEIAEALQAMLEADKDLTQEQLGKQIGKGQGWVSNHLRLLRAPDDLQKLLISQEITPRHAQVLMPLAGHPVYTEAMKRLAVSRKEGNVSVKDVENLVQGVVGNDHNADRVLNFTDAPWQVKEWLPYMDRTACPQCDDLKEIELGRRKHSVCLNPTCFKAKLKAARELKDKNRNEERKEMMEGKRPVNLNLLAYGEFDRLKYAKFDVAAECQGCASRRATVTGSSEDEVCLDPACFKRKSAAAERQSKQTKEDLREKAIAAGNAYIEARGNGPLNARELRMVLNIMLDEGFRDSAPLDPWSHEVQDDIEYDSFTDIADTVPDEDLAKAIMALIISDKASSYGSDFREVIKEIEDLGKPSDFVAKKPQPTADEEEEEEEPEEDAGKVKGYGCPDEDGESYGTLPAAREAFGCDECPAYLNQACRGPSKEFGTDHPVGPPPEPIKVEGEPFPDSRPWDLQDPIQEAHLP